MLISHRHNVGFVAHDFHDGLKVGPVHPQAGSECVSEIMKPKPHRFVISIPVLLYSG